MKPADTHGKWTAREVAARLGVPEGLVRSMVRAGLLQPGRGRSGRLRFSFQDLVLLRAAHGLLTRDVRPERIRRGLAKLLAERPDRPLSAVTLRAEGRQVVVADGRARWNVESGQTEWVPVFASAALFAFAECGECLEHGAPGTSRATARRSSLHADTSRGGDK